VVKDFRAMFTQIAARDSFRNTGPYVGIAMALSDQNMCVILILAQTDVWGRGNP